MKYVFVAAILCLGLVGCSSEPTNVVGNASDEEIANYNKLIADANKDLGSDDDSGAFDK